MENDVSASNLSKRLEELGDVNDITVYINSYGGEVAEGLAIYNSLKRHKATITTVCDGFAASIASVIFMAGDKRVMNDSSLLMIHNAWTVVSGNAQELRKQADDLEKITSASIVAYKSHSTLSEEEIKALMDNETWITPDEAMEYGFATSVETSEAKAASQSAKKRLFEIVKQYGKTFQADEVDPEDEDEAETDETNEEPETLDDEEQEPNSADDAEDEEKPDDEEPPAEDETADDEEDSEDEEETEEAAQRLSGFFNALLKM